MADWKPFGNVEQSGHSGDVERSSNPRDAAQKAAAADQFGETIQVGDTDRLRLLIAQTPLLASDVEYLIQAAYLGRAEVVAELLSAGSPANGSDENGHTSLMAAATAGYREVVQMLIEAGADPNALAEDVQPRIDWNRRGESALFCALEHGHRAVAEYLAPLTSPWLRLRAQFAVTERPTEADLALAQAAARGDLDSARAALAAGADIHVRTGEERGTALHAATAAGHMDVIAFLLEAHADVDARNVYGQTVLWKSAREGWIELARLFLARGADVEARDFDGEQTPLMQAVLMNRPALVAALLAAGADPRAIDAEELSAIDYAEYSNAAEARAALDRGGNGP